MNITAIEELKELLKYSPKNLNKHYIDRMNKVILRCEKIFKDEYSCHQMYKKFKDIENERIYKMYIDLYNDCNEMYSHRLKSYQELMTRLQLDTEKYIDIATEKEVIDFLKLVYSSLEEIIELEDKK